ncbi:hypothetical protein HA402_009567 [Bradysia odoriphaga]|nr:hypothetical protein HA402_009567 [Bradysia odoriphaga]
MSASKTIDIVPAVKAESEEEEQASPAEEEEEEMVCPQEKLREVCRTKDHHVSELLEKYNACNERVNAKTKTSETCEEELFDYIHALDHCVSKTLWSKLK